MFDFLKPTAVLEKRESKYNGRISVKRSWGLGTYIEVGGLTQSGGVLNAVWRSTLKNISHYPLVINNCLILGLGGGTAAKWVKKFWPNVKITGVDIDPVMIELGARYLALGTCKVEIKIEDALKYKKRGYDLVIVDTYCGDNLPTEFESGAFLQSLVKEKTVIFNRLYYGEKRAEAVKFGEKLKKYFKKVDFFYPEANLMLICTNY